MVFIFFINFHLFFYSKLELCVFFRKETACRFRMNFVLVKSKKKISYFFFATRIFYLLSFIFYLLSFIFSKKICLLRGSFIFYLFEKDLLAVFFFRTNFALPLKRYGVRIFLGVSSTPEKIRGLSFRVVSFWGTGTGYLVPCLLPLWGTR